jgi:hypothetical protein
MSITPCRRTVVLVVTLLLLVGTAAIAASCGDSTDTATTVATAAAPPPAEHAASYADTSAEIEALIAQYFWAFDTLDAESFVKLFASDGELVLTGAGLPPEGLPFQGSDKLREFIDMIRERTGSAPYDPNKLQFSPNLHFVSNLVLTLNGDSASGRAYWYTVRRGENHDLVTEVNPNPSFLASIGYYDEEYVREDGKWLFKRIVVREFEPPVTPATTPDTSQDTAPATAPAGPPNS